MLPNPSHLEASHPVVSGKARSRQLSKSYGHYGEMDDVDKVVNIHVHGDAAVAGQVQFIFCFVLFCFLVLFCLNIFGVASLYLYIYTFAILKSTI